jgi:hypothetical protein
MDSFGLHHKGREEEEKHAVNNKNIGSYTTTACIALFHTYSITSRLRFPTHCLSEECNANSFLTQIDLSNREKQLVLTCLRYTKWLPLGKRVGNEYKFLEGYQEGKKSLGKSSPR